MYAKVHPLKWAGTPFPGSSAPGNSHLFFATDMPKTIWNNLPTSYAIDAKLQCETENILSKYLYYKFSLLLYYCIIILHVINQIDFGLLIDWYKKNWDGL